MKLKKWKKNINIVILLLDEFLHHFSMYCMCLCIRILLQYHTVLWNLMSIQGFQPPPGRVGLPLGQYKYEPKRLIMEAERNEEWNVLSKEVLHVGTGLLHSLLLWIGIYSYTVIPSHWSHVYNNSMFILCLFVHLCLFTISARIVIQKRVPVDLHIRINSAHIYNS